MSDKFGDAIKQEARAGMQAYSELVECPLCGTDVTRLPAHLRTDCEEVQ